MFAVPCSTLRPPAVKLEVKGPFLALEGKGTSYPAEYHYTKACSVWLEGV